MDAQVPPPKPPFWSRLSSTDKAAYFALVISILSLGVDGAAFATSAVAQFGARSQLELVDFFPYEGDEHASIRVKLRNTGEEVAVLTRVFFNVERVWRFDTPRCEPEFEFPRSSEGVNWLWWSPGESTERIANGAIAPSEALQLEYKFADHVGWNETRIVQLSFDYSYDGFDRKLDAGPAMILLRPIPHETHYADSHCVDEERIRNATQRNSAFASEVSSASFEKASEVDHFVRRILEGDAP